MAKSLAKIAKLLLKYRDLSIEGSTGNTMLRAEQSFDRLIKKLSKMKAK